MIGEPQYKIMGILLFKFEFCFCQIKEEKAREKICLQKIHRSQDEILPWNKEAQVAIHSKISGNLTHQSIPGARGWLLGVISSC